MRPSRIRGGHVREYSAPDSDVPDREYAVRDSDVHDRDEYAPRDHGYAAVCVPLP